MGHDAAPAPAFVVVEAEEGGAATVVVAADVDGVVEGVAAAVAVVVGAALFEPHADTRAMSEATIAVERRGNEMVVTDAPPGPESDDLDRCLGRSAMRMRRPLLSMAASPDQRQATYLPAEAARSVGGGHDTTKIAAGLVPVTTPLSLCAATHQGSQADSDVG